METESYLNLGSEQFNSWINEFDNKYTKIEKNFETISKNSESEVAVESSESEDEEDSSIFVKKNIPESNIFENKEIKEPSFSSETENTITPNRRLLFNRVRTKISTSESESLISDSKPIVNEKVIKNENIVRNEPVKVVDSIPKETFDEVISLTELNNMLPDYNNKISNPKEIINEKKPNVVKREDKKTLGDVALYKYIMNRRRR